MPSIIKKTGVTGSMLTAMARRGGRMTADYRGFPPSRVFLPLRRRGLVELRRAGLPRSRYNVWHLTPMGWDATGMSPPVADEGLGG
jgi:hypothetical protein